MAGAYLVPVDPRGLVVATLRSEQGTRHVVALSCRYVPADLPAGGRGVAVEIPYDPAQQRPTESYDCESSAVQRILVSPKDLLRVRPYSGAPVEAGGPAPA